MGKWIELQWHADRLMRLGDDIRTAIKQSERLEWLTFHWLRARRCGARIVALNIWGLGYHGPAALVPQTGCPVDDGFDTFWRTVVLGLAGRSDSISLSSTYADINGQDPRLDDLTKARAQALVDAEVCEWAAFEIRWIIAKHEQSERS